MNTAFNLAFCTAIPLCLATLALTASAEDTRRFVTDQTTGAVSMQVAGKSCWTYVPQSKEGKPYFHPLAIPGTGDVLTSFRPPDHNWHLGFWFSWKFINGVNFWEPDTNAATRVLSQTVTPGDDKSFRTEATLAYVAKGSEIVREQRAVSVTTQPNGNYTIEWDSTFTAHDAGAVFDCTPSKKDKNGDWATGGYAGLMWRFTDSPTNTYTFINAAGKTDVKTCGEASDRMEVVATAKASGAKAKITFTDHPENPRHPTPWFARHSATAQKGRGYYLVGPSMIFHEPLKLAPNASARFRYTVTIERL